MPISEATYERVALEDPDGKWELVCGRLRQKPDMTTEHEDIGRRLARRLILQTSEDQFAVEVWSPSTGGTDLRDKLTEHQQRGDLEIWYIHPYERTLIARRRQPDGSYQQARYAGGSVTPASLPGVVIELETLFT